MQKFKMRDIIRQKRNSLEAWWAGHIHSSIAATVAFALIVASCMGVIVGYAYARINFIDAYDKQERRHAAQLLEIRDRYSDRALDVRKNAIDQAKALVKGAESLQEASKVIPGIKAQAEQAAQAAKESAENAAKIKEALTDEKP